MGNRISKVTTSTGDSGTTGLADGQRVEKSSLRIEVIGEVDELNSVVGMLVTNMSESDPLKSNLLAIQHDLFDLGGELAMPGEEFFNADSLVELEAIADQLNSELPALKDFILPGGDLLTAWSHMARTVCRRCERHFVALAKQNQ